MLRKVAQDIPVDYPNLKELIQNMFETNTASDGVGLAAPQIGKSIRVVIIDLDVLKEDFPEYEGFRHAFINAHIVEYDEESKKETMEEGCLSIPGLHERVTRPTRIHVRYLDEELQEHDEWVEGYLARVMQHEFDHLEGKMFVDRVSPLRKSLIMNKLRAMAKGKYSCRYRTKAAHNNCFPVAYAPLDDSSPLARGGSPPVGPVQREAADGGGPASARHGLLCRGDAGV